MSYRKWLLQCRKVSLGTSGPQIGFRLNPRSKFIAVPPSFMRIASFTLRLAQYCFSSSTVADSQFIAWSVVFTWTAMPFLCFPFYTVLVLYQSLQGLSSQCHITILMGILIHYSLLVLQWDRLLDMHKAFSKTQSSHWVLWHYGRHRVLLGLISK